MAYIHRDSTGEESVKFSSSLFSTQQAVGGGCCVCDDADKNEAERKKIIAISTAIGTIAGGVGLGVPTAGPGAIPGVILGAGIGALIGAAIADAVINSDQMNIAPSHKVSRKDIKRKDPSISGSSSEKASKHRHKHKSRES